MPAVIGPAAPQVDSRPESGAARFEEAPAARPAEATGASETPAPGGKRTLSEQERENLLVHFNVESRFLYEDVGRDLGLDDLEAATLKELLVDQNMRWAESAPGNSVEEAPALAEFRAQHQREIEMLIGAERAGKLAEYRKSLQVRYEVEQLRRMLENSDVPLTEVQRREMVRLGIEQQAYAGPTVMTGAESDLAINQETQARNELAHQRLANVARGVLTAEQFARFEARWELSR
jgi:hypothetical protein